MNIVIQLIRKTLKSYNTFSDSHHVGFVSAPTSDYSYLCNVTIDPTRVEDAWESIGEELLVEQFSTYPDLMHAALADTLNRRARNVHR